MSKKRFVPGRGDIIWLDFNPQSGHEQRGRRPAIVLSPVEYNEKAGLALVCPITSHIKGYPFEVLLPEKAVIKGVIIADQVKSLDWQHRNAEFIEKAPKNVINETIGKFSTLIQF